MKIFIINLEKDRDRYLNIVKQLEDNNFYNYERIDAIYGKNHYDEYKAKIPNLTLFDSELGCALSHLKTMSEIVRQNLDYGVVLEDDVTLSEWFPKLESIIENEIPKDFDVCWIGNCGAKWPRNECNLIPDYDYDKLEKYKVNKFVYRIEGKEQEPNIPIGGYGLVISNKGARKVLNDENNLSRAIDSYLVRNKNLKRYMTVPSIIIHCYEFDSNLTPGIVAKQNAFDNVWKRYEKYESYSLEILEKMTELFEKYNINYSLAFGTLLGYGRNKKFIGYDDDIDIMINRKNLDKLNEIMPELKKICNVYKFDKPILYNLLYYKLYPFDNIKIDNYEYGWPFIDIFVYDIIGDDIIIYNQKFKVEEDFIYDYIKSNNSKNPKEYKIQVFRDYKKILDQSIKNWDKVCMSSNFNHMKEENNPVLYTFNCSNIIPDYDSKDPNHYYSKKEIGQKNYFFILISLALVSFGIFIYMLFRRSKKNLKK